MLPCWELAGELGYETGADDALAAECGPLLSRPCRGGRGSRRGGRFRRQGRLALRRQRLLGHFRALQQAGQVARHGLGGLDRRELPADGRLDGHLEGGGLADIGLLLLERSSRLGAEHAGHHAVGAVFREDVRPVAGEHLAQADLVEIGPHAMRVAQHRRHRIKAALGLKFRGGQVGHLPPAAPLRALGAGELVHRGGVGRLRLLFPDDGLVVVLGEDFRLGLQIGQFGVGGGEPLVGLAKRGRSLIDLVLRRLDLTRARHWIAVQRHPRRGTRQPGRRQQTAPGHRPCGPAHAEVTPRPVSHPVPRNPSSFPDIRL